MADQALLETLVEEVYQQRLDLVRLTQEKGLHIGGDLSCAEVIVTLFRHVLRLDPANPTWEGRDRFILSKGHGAGAMYTVMARLGYWDIEEVFQTYKTGFETRFGMHPCKRDCPALEASTGSLGHGLSIACGLALAGKMRGEEYRVFCMLGDGELQEGSNWEAAMAAHQYQLDHLIAIVDRNMLSLDGPTEELMGLEPLGDKWADFGWTVLEFDGNDLEAVVDAFDSLPERIVPGQPTVLIAHTVKAKGISFLEGLPTCHSAVFDEAKTKEAIASLERTYGRKKGGRTV